MGGVTVGVSTLVFGVRLAGKAINRLRVLRAENRMSQAQLADAVGVSRQAINTIENGRHDPSVTLALRIAEALGVDINEAFSLRDEE